MFVRTPRHCRFGPSPSRPRQGLTFEQSLSDPKSQSPCKSQSGSGGHFAGAAILRKQNQTRKKPGNRKVGETWVQIREILRPLQYLARGSRVIWHRMKACSNAREKRDRPPDGQAGRPAPSTATKNVESLRDTGILYTPESSNGKGDKPASWSRRADH